MRSKLQHPSGKWKLQRARRQHANGSECRWPSLAVVLSAGLSPRPPARTSSPSPWSWEASLRQSSGRTSTLPRWLSLPYLSQQVGVVEKAIILSSACRTAKYRMRLFRKDAGSCEIECKEVGGNDNRWTFCRLRPWHIGRSSQTWVRAAWQAPAPLFTKVTKLCKLNTMIVLLQLHCQSLLHVAAFSFHVADISK